MELVLDGGRCGMTPEGGDWWKSDCDLAPGTDYGFGIAGEQPLPDPRSPWQPHGIHGPSRTVDHALFQWTDQEWVAKPLEDAIIYELHVGTFTKEGTFEAIEGKLDHLVELGVTHVELMPVIEFPGDWGWGYDGVDLYAPHHCYGTPDDLKRLVDRCHQRGLAAVLDVVYNHFGPVGNYLNRFGPYTTDRHHTPWGNAVNLDGPGSHEVRRFIADNALMWLRDYHFDGLRLDAVHALIDTSQEHLLAQVSKEVDELEKQSGRPLVLIAESDLNDPTTVRLREEGGHGMDAQWSDDFHHALHSLLTGENSGYYRDFGSFEALAKAIEKVFVFDGCYSEFRGREHGAPPTGIPRHRFIIDSQTHDQVGNRAAGERLSHLVSAERHKIAAALTLLSPCVPMLFQGEEWAASSPFQYFTNHHDEWLAKAVSVGRKSEFEGFGWRPEDVPDPQDRATFDRSKLKWREIAEPEHRAMFDWYRRLIGLRQTVGKAARGIQPKVTHDSRARWMRVDHGPFSLCFSLADQPATVEMQRGAVLLESGDVHYDDGRVRLGPDSMIVVGRG